jgi:monoamine oxidase
MSDVDVIVVGAGPAGLAASMALEESGLQVALLEARDRIGGRTHSVQIGEHKGIDVGAHWLHASNINPLVREARRLGVGLHSADSWPLVIDNTKTLGAWGQMQLWRAWRKIDKGIVRLADSKPGASAELAVNRSNRWQFIAGELHGTHACGTPLSAVSVEDFSNANDSEDRFVEGGYGALVAAAGAAAKPRLGVMVSGVALEGTGVRVDTASATFTARAVLLTIPTTLIANGSIDFLPALPEAHMTAARDLPHGAYERLVFTLGQDPWAGERDRAVILINSQNQSCYMLAGGGGDGVHFADFGAHEARTLAAKGMDAMEEVVRGWLAAHVGADVAASLKPLYASRWSADPLSLGAWSVARPGCSTARVALRAPVENRIWFAGEATSIEQWGTVGGAWLEGLRAAEQIRRAVVAGTRPDGTRPDGGRPDGGRFARMTSQRAAPARKRPRNLT